MVERKRKYTLKPNNPNLFFLNGNLHRKLKVVPAHNLIYAWSYPEEKRVTYVWSEVRKKKENAFTFKQAGALLNRGPRTIWSRVLEDEITDWQWQYSLETKKPRARYISETGVLKLHDYYKQMHYGHPRNDGIVTPLNLPSRAELIALLRNEEVLYVRNKEGKFIPLFKENDW